MIHQDVTRSLHDALDDEPILRLVEARRWKTQAKVSGEPVGMDPMNLAKLLRRDPSEITFLQKGVGQLTYISDGPCRWRAGCPGGFPVDILSLIGQ